MGFAEGFRAGTSMVDSVLSEQRQRKLDARAEEEFGWKRSDRTREEGIRTKEDELRGKNLALYNEPEPAAGLPVPAAQQVDAAQGAAGVRAGTAQGIPTSAVGAPQPAAPVSVGQADAAGAGTATAPTPVQQATPAADRQLGRDVMIARNMQQQALLRNNTQAYTQAKAAEDAAHIRTIDNEVGKMSAKDRLEYVNKNINMQGGMPMVITKTEGGYTISSYDQKGMGKQTLINDAQLAELVASHMMAQKGYASEGFKRAGAIHKDIDELIKAHNTGQTQMQTANNQAVAHRDQNAETKRHHQVIETDAAAKTQLLKDKAAAENNEVLAVGPEGITLMDKKDRTKVVTTPWPAGTTDAQKQAYIKKYAPVADTLKENPSGTVQKGNRLYERNPHYGKTSGPPGVDRTQPFIEITPGGDDAFDKWVASKTGGGTPGAAGAGGAPAAGLQVPPAQQVSGRPLYNANQRDLERVAARPKGVSTAEANAAQAELDARRGEARMQGY